MDDHVDFVVAQWQAAMPELDASTMLVFGRMSRLMKHLEKMRADALMTFGFKEGEFDVLATLRRSGQPYRLSPTQLYRSLMVTSGAMTNRLMRLESAGLIARVPDPHDGRSQHVGLTAQGLALIESAVGVHTQIQDVALGALEPEQRAQLAELLKQVMLSLPGEVAPS